VRAFKKQFVWMNRRSTNLYPTTRIQHQDLTKNGDKTSTNLIIGQHQRTSLKVSIP